MRTGEAAERRAGAGRRVGGGAGGWLEREASDAERAPPAHDVAHALVVAHLPVAHLSMAHLSVAHLSMAHLSVGVRSVAGGRAHADRDWREGHRDNVVGDQDGEGGREATEGPEEPPRRAAVLFDHLDRRGVQEAAPFCGARAHGHGHMDMGLCARARVLACMRRL